MKRITASVFATLAMFPATAVRACETITYTYDALGRLQTSQTSGGHNNGVSTATSFDPVGNRSGYAVSGSDGSNPPAVVCQITGSRGYSFGGYPVAISIYRKGTCPAGQQVSYQTVDGTGPYAAVAGVDYSPVSGMASFPNSYNDQSQWGFAEQTSVTVSVLRAPAQSKVMSLHLSSINLAADTQIVSDGIGEFDPQD